MISFVSRGLLFSLIWWVLTSGSISSWWIGAPAVLLALFASLLLLPPLPFSWFGFVRFVPFFLYHSLLGGVDVARRVFQPRLPIAPDLVEYPLQLPQGLAQVLMVYTVSLLPGTLSAELGERVLKVHVLDDGHDFKSELVAIERHVGWMFGRCLNMGDGDK